MKKTRIIYTDEAHILTYGALPPNEFKELFMKILTYQQGDEVLPNDFSNPALYAMFAGYKCLIDENERKWVERSEVNKKNRAQREVKRTAERKENMVIPTCDIQADDLPTDVEEEPETLVNDPSTIDDYVNMLVSAGKTGIGEWAHVRENFMRYMNTGLTESQKTDVIKEAQRILSNG